MSNREAHYLAFESYLETVFSLIEGMADVEEAQHILSEYLAQGPEELNDNLEDLLIELFFAKCRRTFQGLDSGEPSGAPLTVDG